MFQWYTDKLKDVTSMSKLNLFKQYFNNNFDQSASQRVQATMLKRTLKSIRTKTRIQTGLMELKLDSN